MLQLPILSLFIRLIPETFLVMYAICLLTNSKVDLKKIFISGVIGGIVIYILRLLPIHFGVHTILSVMLYILLAIKLNKIEMYKAIVGSLVATIICFISDIILIAVYTNIIIVSSEAISGQTWVSVVAGLPSLIIFYLILKTIVYFRKKRVKYEHH